MLVAITACMLRVLLLWSPASSSQPDRTYSHVEVTEFVKTSSDHVLIAGKTDLPDTAVLSVRYGLPSRTSLLPDVEGHAIVDGGAFSCNLWFDSKRDEWRNHSGVWMLTIEFSVQETGNTPSNSSLVMDLVGKNGEFLSGPNVAEHIVVRDGIQTRYRWLSLSKSMPLRDRSVQALGGS